jgi:hypothetical protein
MRPGRRGSSVAIPGFPRVDACCCGPPIGPIY